MDNGITDIGSQLAMWLDVKHKTDFSCVELMVVKSLSGQRCLLGTCDHSSDTQKRERFGLSI